MPRPILYSFRRCPYAMRARLGLYLAQQEVELREIVLKHKPEPMLAASPKGTVPVLVLDNGRVIDESLEIMLWALAQQDSHQLLNDAPQVHQSAMALISDNDNQFKPWLDKYKYADRHPEHSASDYRAKGEAFVRTLEARLTQSAQLVSDRPSLADYAIFPFIRQFAHVDKQWWQQAPYPKVQAWLSEHINSQAFVAIMKKYPTWLESGESFSLFSK